MITKIKEAFLTRRSQFKYKIYITIFIRFLFWCLISSHNIFKKLTSFVCAYFINSGLTFVFLLPSLLVTNWYLSMLIFRKYFFVSWVKTAFHTNMCYQASTVFGEQTEW